MSTTLATAAEIALRPSAAVPLNPADRYNRALQLVEDRVFSSVTEAQTYLDLCDAAARGESLLPEARKFLEESRALEEQIAKVQESRDRALVSQDRFTSLLSQKAWIEHCLAVERDRLASIPQAQDMDQMTLANYTRYLGEGAYTLFAITGPAVDAWKMKLLGEFIARVVLPDLERQQTEVVQKLEEMASESPAT